MTLAPSSSRAPQPRAPTVAELWLGGTILLWGLYAIVFVRTTSEDLGSAMLHAAANVAPLALLAAAVRALLKTEVMRRSSPVQALWHAGLAPTFAFSWYALVATALGVFRGLQGGDWEPEGFSGPALTWQVFQGLVLYAAVATACYAVRGGREAAAVLQMPAAAGDPGAAPLRRYLIRDGETMTPVDVDAIVTITGAQDYAEVSVAGGGRHLIRMSLAELEVRLDPAAFVRVHRSAIIHLAQLERTEPAGGGRLLAHMRDGRAINVSRAGAQALGSFLI